jgi:vitamin-K-epoxide reductase (warfarin-sensitive)
MRYLIAVLAVAGIVVSSFALREHYRTEPSPCSINERWDCGAVNHSPFAVIGGIEQQLTGTSVGEPSSSNVASIPVAAVGIAGYLLIAAFALARRWGIVLLLTTGAVAFSAYLTYIEARLLETYCIWCVTSAAIICIIEIAAIVAVLRNRGRAARVPAT